MGVIRKKTAARGGEGGVKYVCDVCSADITSTVRIRCAHNICNDYDLCVPCFSQGESSHNHQPATHPFRVIEQNSVPIYDKNWGADEELLLLEGCEIYGLGSWADVADHIGGYRDKNEVRLHYENIYLKSSNFPLPMRADPRDTQLLNEMPREEFQARKKRRIEGRKEAQSNAPPATPKKKPTASVPACHEVQGYMPGRLEFETEFANEAEEAVQHMQFDPGDGINPRTGEIEPEMELKITVMDIYNSRLTQRAERKKVIFEHNLLEYRKNAALDKKRTKEERDLLNKAKPFARMMNHDDFQDFCNGLIEEHNLRQAVSQLQEWRAMKIGGLKGGEKYEADKLLRVQKAQPMGSLDRERFASSQRSKPPPVIETPSGAAAFVSPDLPTRAKAITSSITSSSNPNKILTNGNGHTSYSGLTLPKQKFQIAPIPGIQPLSLSQENIPDLHLLTLEEIDLCEKTRLHPKPYLVIKESVMKEALRGNGTLRKRQVRELARVEAGKGARIWEFFSASGWIGKAGPGA
ncbi:probable transcriptional adapter 2 [Rhynchosporium agropyri]|uniref:Transcriptional adapter 2 n=2 Tax=Rhynchosporium TaxID=38037 RepID=A0A1E1MJB3_RHYSE|nr:probable transcriptional adapter 2 [Rhynchosporium agropyri]CZT49152.1 probable transcriptional adapter 2 [Rhynchosporium secalis]